MGKAKAPISSHPAFPAIVALWFAALLGVGSMVLPAVLLEKLATATGLASVLPAAQPPLGATARIAVALACAGLGVVAGLGIARKVVAAQMVDKPRKRAVAPARQSAKRPISAMEELGVDKLDADIDAVAGMPAAGRRRALSVTDENRRSDFLEAAPLPGCDPYGPPAAEADALDLGAFAEEDCEPQDNGEPEERQVFAVAEAPEADEPELEERQVFVADDAAEASEAEPEAPAFAAPEAYDPGLSAEESETEMPTPDRQSFDEPAARAPSRPFDRHEPSLASVARRPESPPLPAEDPGSVADRPLRELGMVELVERFALSLQRRAAPEDEQALALPPLKASRAAAAEAPSTAFAPPTEAIAMVHEAAPAEPVAFAPEAFEPESEFVAQFQSDAPPAPSIPAALRPVAFDEMGDDDEEDGQLDGFTLSLNHEVRPFERPSEARATVQEAAFGEADDEAGEGNEPDERGEGYSSLLAMKSPFGASREFVRVEDEEAEAGDFEPVVVFPGQQQQRRALPASDGPSREPLSHPRAPHAGFRPFDGPAHGRQAAHADFASTAMPTRPADKRADPAETERALRDALEKLQRMSGAA